MNTLVDAYEKLAAEEEVEMYKLAEEEAAGRLMARGFWDELMKVADSGIGPRPAQRGIARTGAPAPAAGGAFAFNAPKPTMPGAAKAPAASAPGMPRPAARGIARMNTAPQPSAATLMGFSSKDRYASQVPKPTTPR